MKYIVLLFILCAYCSCDNIFCGVDPISIVSKNQPEPKIPEVKEIPIPIAHHFDFPVGKPDGEGYYNAQEFGVNNHLGDDWNAVTGGNSDLGDTIYAIANGKVNFAADLGGGWGKVIRITHRLPDSTFVESLYAHCDTILVSKDSIVHRGDKIGTIGTANGAYLAHLHFEMRDDLDLPVGGGYSEDASGYLNGTEFIKTHR